MRGADLGSQGSSANGSKRARRRLHGHVEIQPDIEVRGASRLHENCLAKFAANYCVIGKRYKHCQRPKVIRYPIFLQKELLNFERESMLLYHPFCAKE